MIAERRDRSSQAKLPEVFSPFLEPFTVRPKTAEDVKPEAERIKMKKCDLCPPPDDTPVLADLGPGDAGKFHTVRVEAKNRPEFQAKTREGYWQKKGDRRIFRGGKMRLSPFSGDT
jgi:hypothetical protein